MHFPQPLVSILQNHSKWTEAEITAFGTNMIRFLSETPLEKLPVTVRNDAKRSSARSAVKDCEYIFSYEREDKANTSENTLNDSQC